MRKIEEKILKAVRTKSNLSISNSDVKYDTLLNCSYVRLHGNLIYTFWHSTGEQTFSLCNYNTPTTRSRLNALLCPAKLWYNLLLKRPLFVSTYINTYQTYRLTTDFELFDNDGDRVN